MYVGGHIQIRLGKNVGDYTDLKLCWMLKNALGHIAIMPMSICLYAFKMKLKWFFTCEIFSNLPISYINGGVM